MNIIIAFLISVLTLFTVPPYATYENNDTTLDTPIVELNNHTLREVFEDGNLSTKTFSFISYFSYGNNIPWVLNNNYYITFEQQILANTYSGSYGLNRLVLTGGTINLHLSQSSLTSGNYVKGSFKITANTTQTNSITYYGSNTLPMTNNIRESYVINLTSLGISSLTVAQMDYYYSLYLELIDFDGATITYLEYDLHDIALIIFFGFLWLSLIILIKRKVLI